MPSDPLILVLNAGSSSLKLAAFVRGRGEVRAGIERTNHSAGEPRLWLQDGEGREIPRKAKSGSDRASALRAVNLHVRGYREDGSTTTPFDMVVMNDMDRFHLVMDVIDRVPGLAGRAKDVRRQMVEMRSAHKQYIAVHGMDMPEIIDWRWRGGTGLGGAVVDPGADHG